VLLIAHVGAGRKYETSSRIDVLKDALKEGFKVLQKKDALASVITTVKIFEECGLFNAGTGSVLTISGTVEMDACIMTSEGKCGAVSCVTGIKYPIELARLVMEKTDHVILCSAGAMEFARSCGLKYFPSVQPERVKKFHELLSKNDLKYYKKVKDFLDDPYGTVGACAIDRNGLIVAGTSTGGIWGKLPGRVSDSAIPGAGTYCNSYGGISCTGHGEGVLKHCIAYFAGELLEKMDAQKVATHCVEKFCDVSFGLIIVDKNGNPGYAYNTEMMLGGYINEKDLLVFE